MWAKLMYLMALFMHTYFYSRTLLFNWHRWDQKKCVYYSVRPARFLKLAVTYRAW